MQPPDVPERYILDQNFPSLAVSAPWPSGILVQRLTDVDPELSRGTQDWELLLELDALEDVTAFITNDGRILDSSREMVALQRTRLKLIVAEGVGHDSLKATGLLLVHLADIVVDDVDGSMTYRLRPSGRRGERPGTIVNRIASRRGVTPTDLIRDERAAIADQLRQYRPHLLGRWA